MTPTITQSRKRVIECEILRRLMRLRMTSCVTSTRCIHSSLTPRLLTIEAIQGDEVERFSDGGASELDALCWQDSWSVEFGCYSHPVYR